MNFESGETPSDANKKAGLSNFGSPAVNGEITRMGFEDGKIQDGSSSKQATKKTGEKKLPTPKQEEPQATPKDQETKKGTPSAKSENDKGTAKVDVFSQKVSEEKYSTKVVDGLSPESMYDGNYIPANTQHDDSAKPEEKIDSANQTTKEQAPGENYLQYFTRMAKQECIDNCGNIVVSDGYLALCKRLCNTHDYAKSYIGSNPDIDTANKHWNSLSENNRKIEFSRLAIAISYQLQYKAYHDAKTEK
jgi:hypothetical protein